MKLKTLIDIKVDDDGASPEGFDVNSEKLKQEAIKWVKAMDKVKIQGSINWKVIFKNFHEITEEDLK